MANTTNKLADNWEYQYDKETYVMADVWKILEPCEDGKYRGDCEDFAFTWAFIENAESYTKLLWKLATGSYKIWYVSNNGGGHAVLELPDGRFVDNWSKRPVPRGYMEEVFDHEFKYSFSFYTILVKLVAGLFTAKKS